MGLRSRRFAACLSTGALVLAPLPGLAAPSGPAPRAAAVVGGGYTALTPARILDTRVSLERLGVANCGPVDSLRPLAGLTRLTHLDLSESTRVTDGDLRPLLGLPLQELRMASRRHYSPSLPEVRTKLGLP
jgi:hypothetical protein